MRNPDGVSLTEQGRTLYDYVSDLQAREQDVLNQVTGRSALSNGIIRIGAFSSVMRSVIMPSLIPLRPTVAKAVNFAVRGRKTQLVVDATN